MLIIDGGNERTDEGVTMETPMEIFKSEDGKVQVNVIIENETAWLTQSAMAELFGVQKAAISKHLKNIFEAGELQERVVVSKMETTTRHGAIEGKTQGHLVNFYSLDAIIAVGYRVNSVRTPHVQFGKVCAISAARAKRPWTTMRPSTSTAGRAQRPRSPMTAMSEITHNRAEGNRQGEI